MRIAVEGCCHGELDKIYDTVTELERQKGFKIDLLLICGDFQAVRNFGDLQAMAVPQKYQQLNTFYRYYNKEKVAPVLTVFIGGNHEASNYMQELPYGGWVAPNIYYMGYAGIIQVGGVRIGGISGIFKGHDFNKGHFERPPYGRDTVRSVYHIRNLEVFRLKQISAHTDIFISHDWPKGIYHNGDVETLLRRKPFFKQEIEESKLGAQPLADLLTHLQPTYWFAAHLHVKFAAHVEHKPSVGGVHGKSTRFLALDKCLPRRNFLQVLEIPHKEEEGLKIKLDPEWLTILKKTDHLLKLSPGTVYMPGPGGGEKYNFAASDEELHDIIETFGEDMTLPENFVHTAPPILGRPNHQMKHSHHQPLGLQINPQTTLLCTMLDITDPNAKLLGKTSQQVLEETCPSPAGSLGAGSDNPLDDEDSNGFERELPSTIDSSMDASVTSSCHSPSRSERSCSDSFQTANESLGEYRLSLPSSASTPLKPVGGGANKVTPLVLPAPLSVSTLTDDDEELLSILSAQKNKSLNDSLKKDLSAAPPSHAESAGAVDQGGQTHSVTKPDVSVSKDLSPQNSSLAASTSLSSSLRESEESSSSSAPPLGERSQTKPILKAERSSLGMSSLNLSSNLSSGSSSSSLGGMKRASPVSCVSLLAEGSLELSPTVKKLKRRNVSVYTENPQ
ncbi:lariat debranching enzyme [Elysia marginata]|uniref:Lariat debranching enzyme n=1 Tax=Elysia marginata TaxID=1093978 RepID=A0AAV4ER99_9GAST|nr:lariat debranching enzyme [Elysia marginata]